MVDAVESRQVVSGRQESGFVALMYGGVALEGVGEFSDEVDIAGGVAVAGPLCAAIGGDAVECGGEIGGVGGNSLVVAVIGAETLVVGVDDLLLAEVVGQLQIVVALIERGLGLVGDGVEGGCCCLL